MFWLLSFYSVRRVITNDRRLKELYLPHMSNTFLNVLAVPNKAVFCIIPTLSVIPSCSIHLSNPLVTLPSRPIPIVLVKCWKVAHWNAKKLLKNCQKSKNLLPKFQKLLPKFLAIFIQTLTESFIFRSSQ